MACDVSPVAMFACSISPKIVEYWVISVLRDKSIPVKSMVLLRQSIQPADGMFFPSGNLNATMTNFKACRKPVNNPKIQLKLN